MLDDEHELLKPASPYSQKVFGVFIFAVGIPVLWFAGWLVFRSLKIGSFFNPVLLFIIVFAGMLGSLFVAIGGLLFAGKYKDQKKGVSSITLSMLSVFFMFGTGLILYNIVTYEAVSDTFRTDFELYHLWISFCTGLALAVGCFKLAMRRASGQKGQEPDIGE
ncbi:hypothetical protein ACFL9U_10295 [Thermodesulfobacteriota bacterium]